MGRAAGKSIDNAKRSAGKAMRNAASDISWKADNIATDIRGNVGYYKSKIHDIVDPAGAAGRTREMFRDVDRIFR